MVESGVMKVIIWAERGGGVATKHWGCGIIMVSQLPLYQHCHHIHSQVTLTVLSVSTQNHPQPCFISLVQQCCLYIQLNSKLSHYIAIYNVGLWRLQKSQSLNEKFDGFKVKTVAILPTTLTISQPPVVKSDNA